MIKQRPPCPFYGLSFTEGIFYDFSGNECALDNRYRCEMQIRNMPIDWSNCMPPNFTEREKEELILNLSSKDILVYPEEFKGRGIFFKAWYKDIMNQPEIKH